MNVDSNTSRRYEAASCDSGSVGFDLRFTYDKASRLVQVQDAMNTVLESLEYYDASSPTQKGKLAVATRHNRINLGSGVQDIQVKEFYEYGGTEGRLSARRTEVTGAGFSEQWRQTIQHTSLGQTEFEQFPCRWNGSVRTDTPPTLQRTFSQGFLTSVTDVSQGGSDPWLAGLTYHLNGMLSTIDFPGISLDYFQGEDDDHMRRPSSYGIAGFREFKVSYDGSGNVKSFANFDISGGGSSLLGTDSVTYDLTHRVASFGLGGGTTQSYSYDAFTNLTDIQTGMSTYSTQIDSATNRQQGSSAYDAYGHLTNSPAGISFDWDTLGALTRNGSSGDLYLYTVGEERIGILRPNGEVIWRLRDLRGLVVREDHVFPAGTSTGSLLFSDGFESGDTFCWSDGTPSGTYGGCPTTETTTFLHELGFHMVTKTSDGHKLFSIPDWVGTTRGVIDSNGNIVADLVTFPYGELSSGSAADLSPFHFTGHERDLNQPGFDDDVDFMHMRSYWPLYGRFLSPDPVGGSVGNPQSWNRNAYVMGNPVNLVDPRGLVPGLGYTVTVIGENPQLNSIPNISQNVRDTLNGVIRLLFDIYTEAVIRPIEDRVREAKPRSQEEVREGERQRCQENREYLRQSGIINEAGITIGEMQQLYRFKSAGWAESLFHGPLIGQFGNVKMTGPFTDSPAGRYGQFEVVLTPVGANAAGETTYSPTFNTSILGTANYGSTPGSHFNADMVPFLRVGNAPCPP